MNSRNIFLFYFYIRGPGAYLEVIPEKDNEEVNPTCVFKSKQPRDVWKGGKGRKFVK